MAVLRVMGEAIVLQTLLWPDEVRDAGRLDHLDEASEPKEAEIGMARMLVESMAGDFEPEGHVDDYKEAVEALVASKIEGGDVTESPDAADEDADSGEVVDLLAALQRSVERAKQGRGGASSSTADEDEDEEKDDADDQPPAKKTGSARKTTAKKAAPRTSAAKKSPSTRKAASKKAG